MQTAVRTCKSIDNTLNKKLHLTLYPQSQKCLPKEGQKKKNWGRLSLFAWYQLICKFGRPFASSGREQYQIARMVFFHRSSLFEKKTKLCRAVMTIDHLTYNDLSYSIQVAPTFSSVTIKDFIKELEYNSFITAFNPFIASSSSAVNKMLSNCF